MLEATREWGSFLARRLGALVVSLLIVSMITFAVMRFIGNPVYLILGPRYTPEALAALTDKLGLDRPLWEQYLAYLGGLLTGDLGVSRYTNNAVLAELRARLPATLELSTFALLLATLWAVPAGIYAGVHRRGWFARFADLTARAGVSMPNFWLGLLLIYLFFATLQWLPPPLGRIADRFSEIPAVTGWMTIDTLLAGNAAAFLSALAHLAMPALALAVTTSPSILQITRSKTEEIMAGDYIRSARAFGLMSRTVYRYAFRNMLGPVLTMVAMTFGYLLSGTVLVEVVFAWPGIGLYAVNAMNNSDYEPVMGVVLVCVAFYLLVYLAADIVNAIIDPRIRAARA
jgi:peptide/nickel transport system permease protein